MAITTIYTYPLDGTQRDFNIPFEYLARRFVALTLIGTDRRELTLTAEYRFTSKTSVQTNVAWGPADGYERIEIRRNTSATDRLVDFADGSILRASEMNTAQVQTMHIAEEARNMVSDTLGINSSGHLDARARRLINLADPVDPGDAVTLRQQAAWAGSALSQANRAEAEADRSTAKADESAASAQLAADYLQEAAYVERGDWAAETAYAVRDVVRVAGTWYTTGFAHTSATDFATDAEYWRVYQGVSRSDLSGPEAAGLVGWERTPLADTVGTVGGMLSAQWCNVWEFVGLVTYKPNPADPATWDWRPAIQAAVNSGAHVVYFPGQYTYNTLSSVIVDSDVILVGERSRRGGNGGAKIDNIGSGDTVIYSNTKEIYDCGIRNLGLSSTTGHALNLKYGAVRCRFTQNYLYTRATDKSCIAGIYTAGTLGVDWAGTYSCVFEGGEFIVDNVTRSAPIVDFRAAGTLINENCFRDVWLTQSKGIQAIRLMATVPGVYLTNNRFEGLTFEVCSGGGFLIAATSHTKISGISFWDMSAGYDGTLIQISNDTGLAQNRGLLLENFARIGNTLNGAAVDVDLGYSQGTTIINHAAQSVAAAIINFRGRSAVFIGPKNATVQNDGAVTYIEGGLVASPVFTTKAGNQVRDLGGSVDLYSPAGASGLSAVSGGNTQRLFLDANTFYGGGGALLPLVDNTLNLGHTSNRFKTIYAGTGTINTSDLNEKQQVAALTGAEIAVATRLKSLIRTFKFNDAVRDKGEAARIHFGVIAQDVKGAFEAEGLCAERYGVLCYDEWPEIADDGVVTQPYQPAGARYGVRYEELLALVVSCL